MELEEYKNFVQKQRKDYFIDDMPYNLIYRHFEKLGLTSQSIEYFFKNASYIMEQLRENSWNEFQAKEHEFTSKMLSALYTTRDVENMTSSEAIAWFVEKFPMHIYNLNLSNTQSRRSRSGKEFEAIIELILIGADIPMDSQGNIGKKFFLDKGLGKLVDIVSPSSSEYVINKRNTVLISAKTTLRERWQEVPEEMGRTGAREMFLVTLDNTISQEVIETLNDANIQVVTTYSIKEANYKKYHSVISIENLLVILKETVEKWKNFTYTEEVKNEIRLNLEKQLSKHQQHTFVKEYYERQINKFL
ncbi:type II restriction endonuclease [Streptococcus anginosus]|uniref:type II restriction endonuclease n=1 Tax=Streptococcus anginosus TaxID=1328 RepID=UPI00124805E9|nr:type II restriction endonuclease [Streptococcus anginosus]KAA9293329.1 restriction endonuclease [Streptococcus anginosus]KAA9293337.1 restriction endonuclease [Streptococcus anginosus]